MQIPKNIIYCGRGSGGAIPNQVNTYGWLGNPVKIGCTCPVCDDIHNDAGSTLPCYEHYLRGRLEEKPFYDEFKKLIGSEDKLWCFCIGRGQPQTCHTSIMKKVLRES